MSLRIAPFLAGLFLSLWILFFAFAGTEALAPAGEGPSGAGATAALEEALRGLDARVLSGREAELSRMLEAHAQRGIEDANRRETAAFRQVKGREDWERFRDARRSRLRESLGTLPARPPREVKVRVSRVLPGDGYRIEDLVFESRPGLWVTANLYAPDPPPAKPLPGILICHSHHQPKEEGELQDLGASGAGVPEAPSPDRRLAAGPLGRFPGACQRARPGPGGAARSRALSRARGASGGNPGGLDRAH